MDLKNKVAIITGAASGIGKEIALRFAARGRHARDRRSRSRRRRKRRPRRSGPSGGDAFARRDERRRRGRRSRRASPTTIAKYGSIDILVSNAGIQIVHPLVDFPFADWKKLLAIHLDGAFLTTKACLKHMYAGQLRPRHLHGLGAFATKPRSSRRPTSPPSTGCSALHACWPRKAPSTTSRANVVCPGFVRTPLVDKQIPEQAKELGITEEDVDQERDAEGHGRRRVHHHGRRRRRRALSSPASPTNALTGQSLVVSHGWFMQ